MPALYRDYRPKTFSEVINQDHTKTTLQNAIDSGSFAHAYLFTGPRGTGKTSVARIFARAINCLKAKKGEPCNECHNCKQFLSGQALDLIEIDAASNTGVENVREIIEHLKFTPSQSKFKVFIIDEVHMLSKPAFNALLKTLEEPPAHAVFILATTEVHKVPATVISRTQRFDFKKIDHNQLFEHIKEIAKAEKIQIDEESLRLIVNSAEGSARDALSILDKLSSFGKVELAEAEQLLGITNVNAAQKLIDLILSKNAQDTLIYLEELFAAGTDPAQFNKDLLEYLRKVLMHLTGAQMNFALDHGQLEKLESHSKQMGQAQLLYIIRLFLKANKDFESSPSLELPMEIAAAEACFGSTGAPLKATEVKKKPEVNPVQVIKEEVIEQEQQVPENIKIVSYQEILAAWPEMLQKLKEKHSTLMAVMQSARLKDVQNNTLTLAFAYKFHKDSLENKKNAKSFLEILEEIFNTKFWLKVTLEKEDDAGADASSVAMEVFGGEVL